MSDADTELAAALAALASDDDEQALERLVAAWDGCRAAQLVPLIDALASRIEPRHKALTGKTTNDRYEAFRTTVSRVRQADLARLVAILPRLAYGDLGTALDMLLYHWPYTPRMGTLLETVRMPGYMDRLDELRTVHATPRDAPLSDRARHTIAELERLLATDDAGAELLDQVYADPDADAPRLVYADWATGRGDPRGELISLQFARRDRLPDAAAIRRERELLDQYMQRWLAPVWHAIRPYSVRFERGFLASVTVEPFAVISTRPEWSTVITLELAYHGALPMEAFPALRELHNVTPQLLAQIVARPTKLVHLGLSPEPGQSNRGSGLDITRTPQLVSALDGKMLPDLRSLGVWGEPEDWSWLWECPLGRQLTRIEAWQRFAGGSPWLSTNLPPWIREVRIHERTNEARFAREGTMFTSVELLCREASRDVLAWGHMLELVPPSTLRSVRLVIRRRTKADNIERVEAAARRDHPALERFTVEVDPFV